MKMIIDGLNFPSQVLNGKLEIMTWLMPSRDYHYIKIHGWSLKRWEFEEIMSNEIWKTIVED